jgi:hypothetical protein
LADRYQQRLRPFVEYPLHIVGAVRTALVIASCAVIVAQGVPESAVAQHRLTRMGGLVLSSWAGGAASSDLQRGLALVELEGFGGEQLTRRFSRRLGAATSFTFGLSAAYWFNPSWGIRIAAGVSPSSLEVSVSDRETSGIPLDSILQGAHRFGSLNMWTYDAGVLVRIPLTPRGRVAPYGFLGASRVEFQASTVGDLPPEAASFDTEQHPARLAGVVGAGAIIPLQRGNLALAFELSSHVMRTPAVRLRPTLLQGQEVDVLVTGVGESVRVLSYVRLLMGLTWFAW